jgi:hypothetical protein
MERGEGKSKMTRIRGLNDEVGTGFKSLTHVSRTALFPSPPTLIVAHDPRVSTSTDARYQE